MFESLTISNKGVILKESERVFCANEKSTNRFNPFYSWHIFPSGKTTFSINKTTAMHLKNWVPIDIVLLKHVEYIGCYKQLTKIEIVFFSNHKPNSVKQMNQTSKVGLSRDIINTTYLFLAD
jgi:hypothetical protein